MEGIIFIIPVLLVFLFFFIQIFLLFKKIFSFIFKNISELEQRKADDYSPAQKNVDKKKYLFNQTLEKPAEEYIPIADRDIEELDKNNYAEDIKKKDAAVNIQKEKQNNLNNKKKKNKNDEIKKLKEKKNKSTVSVLNFDKLNDLEKAVVLKEVLDKPKALR